MKLLTIGLLLGLSFNLLAASVDLKKSSFKWKGTKITGFHEGNLNLKSASVKLKENGNLETGKFEIDLNSLTVTDLKGEWAAKFLTHIKSKDFFEVKTYPTAKLVINNDNGKSISGKLTIKGKTNPVRFNYTKSDKGISGILKFDRTKFDMIYGSGDFFKGLGDKTIHNEVNLHFNVIIKK